MSAFDDNPVIAAMPKERKEKVAAHVAKAEALWLTMDANQKTAIRFGMFPAEVMSAAEADGFDGHELCCALMDVASKNGGMRA